MPETSHKSTEFVRRTAQMQLKLLRAQLAVIRTWARFDEWLPVLDGYSLFALKVRERGLNALDRQFDRIAARCRRVGIVSPATEPPPPEPGIDSEVPW